MGDLAEAWASAASAISTEPTMPFLPLDEVFLPAKSTDPVLMQSKLSASSCNHPLCCLCSLLYCQQGWKSSSAVNRRVLNLHGLAWRIVVRSQSSRQVLRQ